MTMTPLSEAVERVKAAWSNRLDFDDAIIEDADAAEMEADWLRRVPARFHTARISDYETGVEPERSLSTWAESPSNLVLVGAVGTGKTHAAIACARAAHERRLPFVFAPVVEVLDALRPGGNERLTAPKLAAAPLLILDDLGSEKESEWTTERLYAIVNRRWMEKRPTIVTSNLGQADLAKAVGERLYSRIADGAIAVKLGGVDRRRA